MIGDQRRPFHTQAALSASVGPLSGRPSSFCHPCEGRGVSLEERIRRAPVPPSVETGVVGRLQDHVHSTEAWSVHLWTLKTFTITENN